jgi:hypothetical protein
MKYRCWLLASIAACGLASAWLQAQEDTVAKVTPAVEKAAAPAEFVPPYAHRVNPFRQPDNKTLLASRREAPQQMQLQLKGFINADGLRAVVQIDGQTTLLAAGVRQGDLEVLEVTEKSVTLQRGRHRWTESLAESIRAGAAR